MPFTIVRDDITHLRVDAIVNAANEHLWQGGGVCGAIFAAAGARKLQAACSKIGHCDTGSAVATPAFGLKARYIIHAVGPVWSGGLHGERALLASCYRSSLELAESLGCTSIAFPLLSAGIYGYPQAEALEVAQQEIRAYLATHDMDVTLVLYDKRIVSIADSLRLKVAQYIDDTYVGEHEAVSRRWQWENAPASPADTGALFGAGAPAMADADDVAVFDESAAIESAQMEDLWGVPTFAEEPAQPDAAPAQQTCPHCGTVIEPGSAFCVYCGQPLASPKYASAATLSPSAPPIAAPQQASMPREESMAGWSAAPQAAPRESAPAKPKPSFPSISLPNPLRNLLQHMDAGFSDTLMAMIDERGLKDAQVYKRANLSRQHFSKIRSNPRYRPTKTTVLALAVALELSLEDTELLLERAGFALSHADRRDIIVEYFIGEGIYDIFTINDTLFAFDQQLLG